MKQTVETLSELETYRTRALFRNEILRRINSIILYQTLVYLESYGCPLMKHTNTSSYRSYSYINSNIIELK